MDIDFFDLVFWLIMSLLVVITTPTNSSSNYRLSKNQIFNLTFERFIMVFGTYATGNIMLSFALFPTIIRVTGIKKGEFLYIVIKLISYFTVFLLTSILYKLVVKEKDEMQTVSKYYTRGKVDNLIATTKEQKEVALYTKNLLIRPMLSGTMYIVVCMLVSIVCGIIWVLSF